MTTYLTEFKNIPLSTYLNLRKEAGLSPKTLEAAEIGLKNSVCEVLVSDPEQGGKPIGMGRITGDGGCHCQITDMCVLPEYQGKGIGKSIMEKLMEFINNELPVSCYISLIADGDASFLYEKFGFKDTLPASKGMAYLRR